MVITASDKTSPYDNRCHDHSVSEKVVFCKQPSSNSAPTL